MKSIIDFLFVCTTLIHFISSVQNVTENTSTRQNERHSSTEHTSTFHNEWPHYNSTGHYVTGHTNNDKTKQLISEEVQISQTGVSMTTTMTNTTQTTSSVLTKEGDQCDRYGIGCVVQIFTIFCSSGCVNIHCLFIYYNSTSLEDKQAPSRNDVVFVVRDVGAILTDFALASKLTMQWTASLAETELDSLDQM
ncbi:hypothetical protein KUTeg_017787 [Tegillarca granosa]|uniref:Uncharacterized protein n=1 Tax=Tegillarca granosa TaxID=220873 RepID=A0ABQ9EFY2_TEGGR|nr:hypothetical protein KUTeg_017787 [Tegillarca granosa]